MFPGDNRRGPSIFAQFLRILLIRFCCHWMNQIKGKRMNYQLFTWETAEFFNMIRLAWCTLYRQWIDQWLVVPDNCKLQEMISQTRFNMLQEPAAQLDNIDCFEGERIASTTSLHIMKRIPAVFETNSCRENMWKRNNLVLAVKRT